MASRKKSKANPSAPITLLSLFSGYRKKAYVGALAGKRQESINTLRDCYAHRGLALYIGAGVSQSLGLPSWSELLRLLTVRMMTRRVITAAGAFGELKEEKQWQAIYSIQEQVAAETEEASIDKPKLMMARSIKDSFGERLPQTVANDMYRPSRSLRNWRMRALHAKRREIKGVKLPSSPLLDSIITLARAERDVKGVQAIVNYNYDDLLDEKLREDNVRCVTVRSGKDRVAQGALPCYHVHGVLPVKQYMSFFLNRRPGNFSKDSIGNFVFSEDEYHAEYSDPYRWSNMTQISLLGRYTGLFLGLSMEDPNIRRLVDVTHRQYPESVNFAILPRKKALNVSKDSRRSVVRNLFEEVEMSSFLNIGVRVIWVDSFEEIPVLLQQICAVS